MGGGPSRIVAAYYLAKAGLRVALFDRKLSLTARVVPGGDHSEASWEKQSPFFIETLMYGLDA